MTPTLHTSTLDDILGGFFPTTKHSGGKYLNNANYRYFKEEFYRKFQTISNIYQYVPAP